MYKRFPIKTWENECEACCIECCEMEACQEDCVSNEITCNQCEYEEEK